MIRAIGFLFLALPLAAQVDVLTQHNDNARTGANRKETVLNASNVNGDRFGKLAFRLVDGNVYAQPLVVSQTKIAGRTDSPNVVIVATEHNSVFAFDADDVDQTSTAAQLWHTGPDKLGASVPAVTLSQALGAGVTCEDLTTEIGITSTPAIKLTKTDSPKEGIVFVVAKSLTAGVYSYKLYALNLADGTRQSATTISGQVKGAGAGSTVVAGNRVITFDAKIHLNRPALLLDGNTLYIAFGGHCDRLTYHGWVFAYDVSNPAAPKKLDALCLTPQGKGSDVEGRAGIWMSGQGPAVDDAGNVFFVTGDGTNNAATLDLGNSVVRVNLTAGKLQVQDWYSPQNRDELKNNDADLGSAGASLIPNSHLLLAAGKEGRMYLVDRNDMGKGTKLSLHSVVATREPLPRPGTKPIYWNIHGSPVVWSRAGETFVYLEGEEDHLKQFKLVADADPAGGGLKFDSDAPFQVSIPSAPYPNFPDGLFNDPMRGAIWMPGGFLSISSDDDKDGTGIVWATMPFAEDANHRIVAGILRAFDATDVSKQLWDSHANPADGLGMLAKFCPPTIANGKVYVATFQQEIIGEDRIHRPLVGGAQPAIAIYGPK